MPKVRVMDIVASVL